MGYWPFIKQQNHGYLGLIIRYTTNFEGKKDTKGISEKSVWILINLGAMCISQSKWFLKSFCCELKNINDSIWEVALLEKKLHVYLILLGCQSQSIDGCSQFEKCHKRNGKKVKKTKKSLKKNLWDGHL